MLSIDSAGWGRTRYTLALLVGLAACGGGDDAPGPSRIIYSGNYPGQFYAIATSTTPSQRDSISGGAVTLTLTSVGGDLYRFSAGSGRDATTADVSIDQTGSVSFPGFDQDTNLEAIGALLTGICDLSDAAAAPSGSIIASRLTIRVQVSDAVCDWSGGFGADIRPTHLQLTWTGTKS